MKGTSSSQAAVKETLDDLSRGVMNASTDTVTEAAEDSNEDQNSQDVASVAIQTKN